MSHDRTQFWTTKDGRNIRVCDMSDRHLNNTVAYIKRRRAMLAATHSYLSRQEFHLNDTKMPDVYEAMIEELKLRSRLVNIMYYKNNPRPLEL